MRYPSAMLILLAACGPRAKADDGAATAAILSPENLVVVAEQRLRTGPGLSGDLEPEREAVIRAEIGGSVLSLLVEAGEAVRAGQALGTLDGTVAEEQYRSAKSGVLSAENSAQVARRELERSRRLLTGGAIAERDVEIAERGVLAAEAQLENAKAGLAAAEKQRDKAQLRAPFDGIVSERLASVGDVVQPGTQLFTVVDPSSMQLEASVPASALAVLRVGAPVEFTVSGYDGQGFTGHIERINPSVDPGTRQVRLTVSIPNAGRALVAGLFAKGRVAAEEKLAPAVPLAVVDQRGPAPTVRRIHEGRVEVVAVQLGLRDDMKELVEVLSGVAVGDTVLLAGAQGIPPGSAVVVRKE